ncbi:unnamed protein product, partial [Closterium sp. Naga37s-1]
MSLVSSVSPLPPLLFRPPIQTTLWRPAPLKCPPIRVLSIATSFSRDVTREAATRNARGLCIAAGRPDTPVVQGPHHRSQPHHPQ